MTTHAIGSHPVQMWELEFTFGDRVRKARRVLGLTVEQMATGLGVTKQVVSQWETGVSNPRSPHAIARTLEYVYGVPAWWVLGNNEPPAGDGEGLELRARRDSNPQPSDPESNRVSNLVRGHFGSAQDAPNNEVPAQIYHLSSAVAQS